MRRVVLILFLVFPFFCLIAQERVFYIDNDSIRDLYEQAISDKNILKPQRLMISEEEVVRMVDKLPSFGVFRDTYFITGIPLNKKTNPSNADITFQISIRQRLTKSVLPYNTFLYLTYSQKSFWNAYSESSPFRDTNYNPGIGIGKSIVHNNRLLGGVFFQLMHESNGREDIYSRSWNYISLSGKYFLNARVNLAAEVWIPWVDGENNRDLLDYRGIGYISTNFTADRHKWWFSAKINPRKGFININTELTAGFKLSTSSNQYLYARLYNGYGESLLDYNQYSLNFRIGICIKPDFYSIF